MSAAVSALRTLIIKSRRALSIMAVLALAFNPVMPLVELMPVQAASTVTIYDSTTSTYNEQGEWWFDRDTTTSTDYEFNTDEAVLGDGALYVPPISSNASDKFIGEYFVLEDVDAVDSISYDYMIGSGGVDADENHFYMNVYANWDGSLDYGDCVYNVVPETGDATVGTWSTEVFVPTDSYDVRTRVAGPGGIDCPSSPSDLPTAANIRMIAINVGDTGASDEGLDGYYDNVIVAVNGDSTAFDFEPLPQVAGMSIVVNGNDLGCDPVINQRDIVVDWDDVNGADHYEYRADADMAAPFDFTTTTANSERAGTIRDEDGTYNYQVRAVNSNGEMGEWSDWCGVTLDRVAPVVEINLPSDNSEVGGVVNVNGTVADDNLSHYNASLYPADTDLSDGETHSGDRIESNTVITSEFSDEVVLSFDSTSLADGEYQVRLAARDLAGNRDTSNTETGGDSSVHVITITIDNEAPTNVAMVYTEETSGDVIESGGTTDEEFFTFNLTADGDVDRWQLRYWNDIPGSTFNGEENAWTPNDLSSHSSALGVYKDHFTQGEGNHFFSFSACDAVGNCSDFTDPAFVVDYDTTPPVEQGFGAGGDGDPEEDTITQSTSDNNPGNDTGPVDQPVFLAQFPGGEQAQVGGEVEGTTDDNSDDTNDNGDTLQATDTDSDNEAQASEADSNLPLWWWLLILAVFGGGLWLIAARRRSNE